MENPRIIEVTRLRLLDGETLYFTTMFKLSWRRLFRDATFIAKGCQI